ncbi:MAG: flagellar hook-length control protein FliK [Lachnospiraceae bacterium]|nr:flagellar hook-length control protein FliK [Lachnospiraceae bacterium]
MSNISVNSLDSLFANNMPAKASVKATENFDETLKGVSENTKKPQMESEKAEVNKPEDKSEDKVNKFEASKKREQIKKQEEPTDEQMAAAMEEVVSQIKEFIQEKFGVTEEELNSIMSALEITDDKLLDVNALTQIVMKLDKIENPSDMLVNPNFNEDLKELLSQVEQIKTETLEFKQLVENETKQEDESLIIQNLDNVETDVVKDDVLTEDEEVSVDETKVQVETVTTEEIVTEEVANNNANNQMESKEQSSEKAETEEILNVNTVRPEDFAVRLTEDLSAKVGERQAITIVRQVVEQVSVQTKQGMTTMELQLYPAHLGRVVVQLVSRDGNVTAQITAETEAAKNALEGQLTLLKENLVNQGVRIENVEVTIASHAFEQNMQGERQGDEQSGSKNRGRRAAQILGEDLSTENFETPEIIDVMGNTVSYSA